MPSYEFEITLTHVYSRRVTVSAATEEAAEERVNDEVAKGSYGIGKIKTAAPAFWDCDQETDVNGPL